MDLAIVGVRLRREAQVRDRVVVELHAPRGARAAEERLHVQRGDRQHLRAPEHLEARELW